MGNLTYRTQEVQPPALLTQKSQHRECGRKLEACSGKLVLTNNVTLTRLNLTGGGDFIYQTYKVTYKTECQIHCKKLK